MKKFIIEKDFWELFPNAKVGVIICSGIDNSISDQSMYEKLIRDTKELALTHIKNPELSQNEVIKVWREAFKKFKTKKGARSSIEALLKRVATKKEIGTINPLVDIYNSASLRYSFPCGGEDISTFEGDIRLTMADGNEDFITLGTDKNSPPSEGEIIYKDDLGAICRCWNWRESVRTMLTEDTRDAFLCLESLDESRLEEFKEALEYLKTTIKENLGGKLKVEILDINNPQVNIK